MSSSRPDRTDVRHRVEAPEGGFTLIELLMVIVILGVLSSVVVIAVGNSRQRGAVAACKADTTAVATALEAYKAENAAYPAANAWASLTPNYLRRKPTSGSYSVHFTASGQVYVGAATGAVTYNNDPTTGNDVDINPSACNVAS